MIHLHSLLFIIPLYLVFLWLQTKKKSHLLMLNLTSFLKHWGQVGFEVSVFGMCKKDDCKNFHPITITIIFIVQTRRIQSRCICCFYQRNNCKTFLLQLYKWKWTKQYGGKDNKQCCSFWSEGALWKVCLKGCFVHYLPCHLARWPLRWWHRHTCFLFLPVFFFCVITKYSV